MKLVDWWGNGVFFFVCFSIFMLGVGGIELPVPGLSFSAWSISRTAFIFWLIWKVLVWIRCGRDGLRLQSKLPIPPFVFIAVVTVSLVPTFSNSGDYRYFLFGALHFLIVFDLFAADRGKRLFVLIALVPGLLFVRGVLYAPSILDLSQMVRFGYPLDHPNTAGYLFAMSIPVAIGTILGETARLRVLGGFSLALQALGLILTYSRTAWLGSLASVLCYGLAVRRYKEILFPLAIASFVLFFVPPVQERLSTLINPREDEAISERIQILKDSLTVGFKHPILGIGYGRGRLKQALAELNRGTEKESIPMVHAHNLYAELFAGTGLLGLAAFLWLLGDCLYKLARKALYETATADRFIEVSILTSLIAFSITGLGDVPFHHHETRIYFFTLVALTYIRVRKRDSEVRNLS